MIYRRPNRPQRLTCKDKETDIALLGTGATQVFPDYELTTSLGQLGIALEVMDTGAACRCYNILISEGRALVALLYMIGH